MYEIRQTELSDWKAIERFVAATYGASAPYKGAARWRWQMVDTPYFIASESRPHSWIALHAGEVVGQISLQDAQLWIGQHSEDVGWIVDVMIHPEHRGQGLGHKIYRAIHDTGKTMITLTMAEATRRMAERLGCITLAPVDHLVRIERLSAKTVRSLVLARTEIRPSLRKLGRIFSATRFGPALLGMVATVVARLLSAAARPVQIEPDVVDIERFLPEFLDNITTDMRAKLPAMFDRSPQFCAWRFDAVPDLVYGRAQRIRDGKPVGMVVWRLPQRDELSVGTIVDILVDPDDNETIEILVSHALARMSGSCDTVVAGSSHPSFKAGLARMGFFTMRQHRPTVVSNSPRVLELFEKLNTCVHMSKADHDWDQIHAVDH